MYAAVISATDVFSNKKTEKLGSLLINIMIHEREKKQKTITPEMISFVSSSKRRFHWFLDLKRSQRNRKATLGPDGRGGMATAVSQSAA